MVLPWQRGAESLMESVLLEQMISLWVPSAPGHREAARVRWSVPCTSSVRREALDLANPGAHHSEAAADAL